MKIFRYRKPSINTFLGITKAKRRFNKMTGISAIRRYTPSRIKQRIKQKVGIYNNPTMTVIRQTSKGKLPSPFGILSKIKFW